MWEYEIKSHNNIASYAKNCNAIISFGLCLVLSKNKLNIELNISYILFKINLNKVKQRKLTKIHYKRHFQFLLKIRFLSK